jgi:hypothetical protein
MLFFTHLRLDQPQVETMTSISYENLFKLRLAVARFGEMDAMRWWNTKGILGRYGALALSRGFPKTHRFAQAKVAFSVAAHRCREIYDPPNACTLWHLPAQIEDRFQDRWHGWLEDVDAWEPFFATLEDVSDKTLLDLLSELELISPVLAEKANRLRRSAEGRSVQITGLDDLNDEALALLAAGFFRGETGKPAIPYLTLNATHIDN